MKDDIVTKLNREFAEHIASERQVVYILVEVRKLLEQQNVLQTFPTLRMCSNWAVHPKLNHSDAQLVLGYFDAYELEHQKSGITVQEFPLEPLQSLMSLKAFRAELVKGLAPYGVNVDVLQNDVFWQSFIQHYAAVIQDCPLEAKESKTQLVSHVLCTAWSKEKADVIFPGKRVIQWNWKLKTGIQRENFVCALI